MGCLGFGIALLLALAVPASIAPTSLVGAYVVIAVLAVLAVAGWRTRSRKRPARSEKPAPSTTAVITRIAAVAVVYAAIVTLIHVLA